MKISCGTGCARKVQTPHQAGLQIAGGTYRVTGTGDIAPYVPILDPLGLSFKGTLVGLIAVIALAALFITAEYRRGMIRTTFAASPHRGRVLAAKALVIGTVTFVAGLAGAAVALVVTAHKLSTTGWVDSVFPVWPLLSAHGLQMVLGTAGLFALAAILAVAAGATLRRSAGAITAVIGVLVVPLILGTLLPMGPAQWLLRLTPAAAFSVQQGTQSYSAGDPRVPAVQRLLPAVAVARVRGAGHLGGARAGRCHVRAPAEGRMSAGRHAQLAGPAVALATAAPAGPAAEPAAAWPDSGKPCAPSGRSCGPCRVPPGCWRPRSSSR